jgi:hypothetical protein
MPVLNGKRRQELRLPDTTVVALPGTICGFLEEEDGIVPLLTPQMQN